MDSNEKVGFNSRVRLLKGENCTLLANMDNGECLFLSNECVNIIEKSIEEDLTYYQLIEAIEDKASKNYMAKLISKLEQLCMWNDMDIENMKSEFLNFSIDITNNCNLRCKHCCVSAGDQKNGSDLSTEKMLTIVKSIARLKPASITVSGGEPLYREDFITITDQIRQYYKGTLILMTNATLITESLAKYISEKYDAVDISIDGIDEETCSILRGKGVFEKALKGLKLLKAYNMRISASMVLSKETKELGNQFLDYCKNTLHVKGIIRCFEDTGRGNDNKKMLEIDDNDCKYKNKEDLEKYFLDHKISRVQPQIFACKGARTEFQINHLGEIFPCASFMENEFSLGNILEIEDLRLYFDRGEYKKTEGYKRFYSWMPFNQKECGECNKQLLCFSCANTVRKTVNHKDFKKWCKYNNEYFDMYWRCHGTI